MEGGKMNKGRREGGRREGGKEGRREGQEGGMREWLDWVNEGRRASKLAEQYKEELNDISF